MNVESVHFRIAGACAIAAACCAIAGAAVGAVYGLGAQNLPIATPEQLARLVEYRTPFLVREWFFLLVAVFGVGEGLGLYYLLRKSPLAIWALTVWIAGLTIGIVEDAAVIAVVDQVSEIRPDASNAMRDAVIAAATVAFETIKVQQFVSILLCCTVGYCVFSVVGYRQRVLPLWMCITGILAGVSTGCFGFCNVVPGFERGVEPFENGFALTVVWDLAIGIRLLRS